MKKIFLASLLVGGMSCAFPSFVQAIGGSGPQPTRAPTEEYKAPLPHVAQEPVSIAEINDIFSSLNALRTNPHARDAQVPQMATTLKQAFQEQYPECKLRSYEEALSDFLRKAEAAGTIARGSHGAGRLLVDLVKQRLKAIPQGSLLHATREILPVCIELSQIARDEQLRTLLDLSVQKDGTNSALYGAFLLHASSALSSLMEERTRQGNAAAEEAAVSSSYLLGAGGGADRRLSEGEELSLALAMSQQDLQKSTRQGNAAAEEAAVSSSYLLGAGGGADGRLSYDEALAEAIARSLRDNQ
ncbi:MAG: hypothetical protein ACRC12_00095 [Holosporales bacterium]